MHRTLSLAVACSIAVLAGCSAPRKQVPETGSGTLSLPAQPFAGAPISFLQISGRWSIRAVPETGDTTPTTFVLSATSSDKGWTITFPGGAPIPTRVLLIGGDSVVTETGPYPSTRRPGVRTITRDVYHLRGDELVGTSFAHYITPTPDSLQRMRLEGSHAP